MSDPLDSYLAHAAGDPPSRDLAARIQAAVARRQRAQAAWRRLQTMAAGAALVGLVLVLMSWAQVADSLAPAWNFLQANDPMPVLSALAVAPAETLAAWLDAGLAWQTAQAQDIGLLFTLGVGLLSVAAFAGLARMLNNAAPGRYSP